LIQQGFQLEPMIDAVRACVEQGSALPEALPALGL
jgi:cysteine synthase A